MVKRHAPAIGYHAVNKLQALRMKRERTIACVELLTSSLRQLRDSFIKDIVLVNRNYTETPPGAPKVFRKGIHANCVVRYFSHERTESGHEGAVDIVGNDDEVRSLSLNQVSKPVHRALAHRHGWW